MKHFEYVRWWNFARPVLGKCMRSSMKEWGSALESKWQASGPGKRQYKERGMWHVNKIKVFLKITLSISNEYENNISKL